MSIRMKSLLNVAIVYSLMLLLIVGNLWMYHHYNEKRTSLKNKINSIKKQKTSLESMILQEKGEIVSLKTENERLKSEKQNLKDKIDELKKNLLTDKDFPILLRKLQSICKNNNIELLTMLQTADDETFPGSYSRSFFTMKMRGTYENIVRFLGFTESFAYLIIIKDFAIESVEPENGMLEVGINLMVYLKESA